jgi:hypothetical protein
MLQQCEVAVKSRLKSGQAMKSDDVNKRDGGQLNEALRADHNRRDSTDYIGRFGQTLAMHRETGHTDVRLK